MLLIKDTFETLQIKVYPK